MQVDGSLHNLLQGVSQQNPAMRHPGQCTEQINAVADIVDGWKRRPPTDFIATLMADPGGDIRYHAYDTGTEQYVVIIAEAGIKVFNLLGVEQTVTADNLDYIICSNPVQSLSVATIGDYNIVANSEIPTAFSTAVSPKLTSALLYFHDGGEYGRKYAVLFDGVVAATYTTPGGATPGTEAAKTGTEYVAQQIYSQLSAGVPALSSLSTSPWVLNLVESHFGQYWFYATAGASLSTTGTFVLGTIHRLTYQVLQDGGGVFQASGFCAPTALPTTVGWHTVSLECTDDTQPINLVRVSAWSTMRLSKDIRVHSPVSSQLDQFTYAITGSVIELSQLYGNTIAVTVTDDRGGLFATAVQTSVKKTSLLPMYATPGLVVNVTGEGTNDKDDLYFKFVVDEGLPDAFGSVGTWRETVRPLLSYEFNSLTMPHALIRLPDNTFYFGPLDGRTVGTLEIERWLTRDAGDENSNPIPAFIGYGINQIGTFQERLYMLADEYINLSASNSFFNFWKKTAATLLDTDPIEVANPSAKTGYMRYAVQFNRDLVIFTSNDQLVMPGRGGITPHNAYLAVATSYSADMSAQPVAVGSNVFFGTTYGEYAGVRELFVGQDANVSESRSITEHIKRYIPGSIDLFTANSNLGVLLARSTEASNTLYIYQYMWDGNERKQAAWGKWVFPFTIRYMNFVSTTLILTCAYNGNLILVTMDMTDAANPVFDFSAYMDMRVRVELDAGDDALLPYIPNGLLLAVQEDGTQYPGMSAPVNTTGSEYISFASEFTGTLLCGLNYTSSYTPTNPAVKDQNGAAMSRVHFNLARFIIWYKNTGGFTCTLSSPHYPQYINKFTARTVGSITNIIGQQPIASGVFPTAVRRKSVDIDFTITSNTYLPLFIEDIEYEGSYVKKGRRL